MMFKKLISMSFILFIALGLFKVADAHVTLNPNAVSYTHLTLPTNREV